MDIDKAIEIIKRKTTIPRADEDFSDIEAAYNLAVMALEYQRNGGTDNKNVKEKTAKFINSRWVPVTEQLPEVDLERILVCLQNGGVFMGFFNGSEFLEMSSMGIRAFPENNPVVAWQPKPEPYQS